MLKNKAYVHFWYLLPGEGSFIDLALLALPHSSPPVIHPILKGRVTYLSGKVKKNKLGVHSPALLFFA